MGFGGIEERATQSALNQFVRRARAVLAQHRDERFEKAQTKIEVLEFRPRETHQNESPPCATFRGRTVPTTSRDAVLVALEKTACPVSSDRIKSASSTAFVP